MSNLGGVDWDAVCATLQNWAVLATGLQANSVVWAQQDAPRPVAPAVICRISNIAETGQPFRSFESNPFTFTKTVSVVNPTADTLTIMNHGLGNGDGPFQLSTTGTLPGNTAPSTNYWVIVIDGNTVQLADTFQKTGGTQPLGSSNPKTPLDLTSAGSGTLTIASTASTLQAGKEIKDIARCYLRVTLELHCHAVPGVGANMATSILQRVRTRRVWETLRQMLRSANIGFIESERVRAVAGVRDALLFEPRAYLDVHFCVPAEETEFLTYIETADLLDIVNNRTIKVGT